MSRTGELLRGAALAPPLRAASSLTACLLAAALVVPLTRPEEWIGYLPTTLGAAEQGSVWMSMVACGAGAWLAGQARTHGFDEWSSASPRSAAARLVPALALLFSIAVAAQLLATAVLLLFSTGYGLSAPGGNYDLLLLLPTMWGYVLFWIVSGVALGRFVRREIALPLAGVLPYVAYAALALYAGDGPFAAFALGDGRSFDYVRPTLAFILARGVFWVSVGLLGMAALLQLRRTRSAAAWITSLSAGLVLFQGPAFVALPTALDSVCLGVDPVICIDGSHASVLPRYRSATDNLWSATPAALRPDAVGSDDAVLKGQPGTVLVVPPVRGFTSPSRLIDRTAFSGRYGDQLFLLKPCRGGATEEALVLVLWWRLTNNVPVDGSAFVGDLNFQASVPNADRLQKKADAIAAMSLTEREAWFRANAAAIRACEPWAVPLAS